MDPRYFRPMRAIIGACAVALLALSAHGQAPARIEVTIGGAAGDTILLANYYGNQLFYNDTAVADANGLAVFARKGGYLPGLYVVLPGSGRIPVVVNEPVTKLATQAADPLGALRVLEGRENKVQQERRRAEGLSGAEREAALTRLVKDNTGTFAAQLIHMEEEPKRVELRKADGSLDSAATARYQRAHYWDHTDLTDDRIVRAPVFQNRLEVLLAVGIAQQPDSITAYLEQLIARAGKAEAVKQFVVYLAVHKYAEQPTQGLGAVAVNMAQRHVCTGPGGMPTAQWTPQDEWRQTCLKTARKAALVVGAKSRDIVLADTTGTNWVSMHAMPQPYVVVVFWSPHCAHCKQSLPLLHEKYLLELKPHGVGFYAVAETADESHFNDWKAFVRQNKLEWTNVGVPWPAFSDWRRNPARYAKGPTTRESLNYAETWEVVGTPKYYILDRERRIVAQPGTINDMLKVLKDLRERK